MKINALHIQKGLFSLAKMRMCFVLLFISYGIQAQNITSVADTTHIKIGEEIKLSINVKVDSTATVLFPEEELSFLPLEMIESYPIDTIKKNAKYTLIKKYGLTQFDSGSYFIPKQKIVINDKNHFTDSIRIAVADVPVDTLKQKMFHIKELVDVKEGKSNWWIHALILAGILGLFVAYFYFFVFSLKAKKEKKKKRKIPAYDLALLQLNELDKSKLLINSEYKDYYSQLTNIVRQYIEDEVHIDALESTTEQLITKLEAQKDAGQLDLKNETIRSLKNVLQTADLVKFAKSKPDETIIKSDRNLVEHIVVETKEAIPEISEEELQKNEEYRKRMEKELRKKRRFRNAIIGGVLFAITLGGIVGYYTLSYIKENTRMGHAMTDLIEDEWVDSQYGSSGLLISTPKVLNRLTPIKLPKNIRLPFDIQVYEYNSYMAPFMLRLETLGFKEETQQVDAEVIAEKVLKDMEARGTKDLVVKYDEYESPIGVEGLRMYGSATFYEPYNLLGKFQKREYDIYIFSEKKDVYILQFRFAPKDDRALEVKEKVMKSLDIKEPQEESQNNA